MNAGKLVAQIAALAIIVYCSYSAVISAVPMNTEDLQNPVSGLNTMQVRPELNGGNLDISIEGDLTSNLPQDIVDVKIGFFIGKGNTKVTLIESTIGTLPSKSPIHISEALSIPMCTILSYAACAINPDGTMKIPLHTQVAFKYFEWQSSYLIDLDITVNTDYQTEITPPVITKGANNEVSMELTIDSIPEESKRDLITAFIASPYVSGDYTFTCNGASFSANVDKSGSKPVFTITATGTADKTATELLQSYLDEHGSLTVEYNSSDYTIDKSNAESFIAILSTLYEMEVTP